MNFQDYLATFPSIDHLGGLDVQDAEGKTVHHIPAVQGKLGSLKLYNALAERFDGKLGKEAAEQGLIWFAEHVADARAIRGSIRTSICWKMSCKAAKPSCSNRLPRNNFRPCRLKFVSDGILSERRP